MNKYQSYKSSGVEWIGEIPDNWLCSKVRFEGKIIGRIGYRGYTVEDIVSEGEGVITLSPSNITKEQKLKLSDSTYITREKYIESPEIQIFNGDIIIVKTSSLGKITIIENCNQEMTLNPQLVVYKQIKQINKFIYYFLISNSFQYQLLVSKSGGVTPTITQEVINSFKLVIPPLHEQKQIVQFLDEKTELIDKLISTKERKISLLKEQRTSLINEVVTKGLNPNVKMKDSGVEWIGEIPEGWSVKRVKYLLKESDGIKIGPFGSSLKLDTLSEFGIKVYGQGNVIKDDFTLGERYIPLERFQSDFSQYEILDGDVLITMMGTTGKCKVFSKDFERGILDSHLLRLRFDKTKFNSLLFSVILEQSNYLYNQIKLMSKGSIMEGLNSSIVKELFIFTPSLQEQSEILQYLDFKTKEIDDLVQLEQKKIDLLKEYRQSLISEVVTGKIKVTTDE